MVIFFFNDTATTEIYTLSLHDALPILRVTLAGRGPKARQMPMPTDLVSRLLPSARRVQERTPSAPTTTSYRPVDPSESVTSTDRKSTRLNSSHANISYAVFCLKKK